MITHSFGLIHRPEICLVLLDALTVKDNLLHYCHWWTFAEFFLHLVDALWDSLKDDFDSAVGEILDTSCEAESFCLLERPISVADVLDSSGDEGAYPYEIAFVVVIHQIFARLSFSYSEEARYTPFFLL